AVDIAVARGRCHPDPGADRGTRHRRRVERIGPDVPVNAVTQVAGLDPNESTEAPSVVRAIRAGHEDDALHEVGVDRPAKSAPVIERWDLDAVDVNPSFFWSGSPNHELSGAERR